MNRWGIVLLTAALVAASCDRSDSEGPSGDETESTDTSEKSRSEPDTEGGSDGDSPDWSERVRQELKAAESEAAETAPEAKSCEFFPDTCGEGEACFSASDGAHQCLPFDRDASREDSCKEPGDCDEGQQCVGGSPGRCRSMCNPKDLEEWGCREGAVCTRVRNAEGKRFEWGVCRERVDKCEPWPEDDCAAGEACIRTRIGNRCLGVRSDAGVGTACEDQRGCALGQICVAPADGDRRCHPKCDAVHPCERGRCAELTDRPFGYCTEVDRADGELSVGPAESASE